MNKEVQERLKKSRLEEQAEVAVEQPKTERQMILDRIRRDKEQQAGDQGRTGGRGVPTPVVDVPGPVPGEED
jgi:hypothetical protein